VLNPGVPRALDGIAQKALGKTPGERYGSASSLLADLRAVRDALRTGGPLSWSPLDSDRVPVTGNTGVTSNHGRPQQQEETATIITAGRATGAVAATMAGADAAATMVMPGGAVAAAPAGGASAADAVAEARSAGVAAAGRSADRQQRVGNGGGGGHWLGVTNLFLLTVLVAAMAFLGYVLLNWVRPPEDTVLPNLVGRGIEEARRMGKENGFKVVAVEESFRDNEKPGIIYQMKPSAGLHIRQGRSVSVWVSRGPRLVDIPDVTDMSVERATAMLEKYGLRVGKIEKEFDPIIAKGNVMRQKPEPPENKPRNTRVDLVLSKGEEPPPPSLNRPHCPEEYVPEDPGVGAGGGMGGDTSSFGDAGTGTSGITGNDSPPSDTPRIFTVQYVVPNDEADHRIRIDVFDRDGMRVDYDAVHRPGERVVHEVNAYGKKVTIKLYDNDILRSEQTR
jgi:hypothetical protein